MIKKFAILIFCIFALNIFSFAKADLLPRYMDSVNFYGIGLYLADNKVQIYSDMYLSKLKDTIYKDESGIVSAKNIVEPLYSIVAYVSDKNIIAFAVADETDNALQIITSQKTGEKGWVKRPAENNYLSWYEFMNKYGKEKGIYFLKDIDEKYKKLHTAPHENSQILKDCYYSAENIKMIKITGNWMLVKVIDFDKSAVPGWIKWRDENGKIFVFPDFEAEEL